MKYNLWLNEWLVNYVRPFVKQKTLIRYEEIVNGHLIKKLGNYTLDELTPILLQKYIVELLLNGNLKTGRGLSSNSVNAIINVIQLSLKCAFSIGKTKIYTADKIKRPKVKEKQISIFTYKEQKKLEQYILSSSDSRLFGIILCLYTGLRIGELLALQWTDINLKRKTISITKTCYDCKNADGRFSRMLDTPKSDSSVRVIPLPKQLIPYLSVLKKENTEYVISNHKKIMFVRTYQSIFSGLLKKLNLPHRGFHALRHTFATRALECGMDVKTLSEILGHKNSAITLNRYTHSLMEHKANMMNKLGKLL